MEKTGWKILAIIFIVLFVAETLFLIWSIKIYDDEVKKTNMCYYDICAEYPQAELKEGVCFCYDYDTLGNYVVVETEVM